MTLGAVTQSYKYEDMSKRQKWHPSPFFIAFTPA